MSKYNRVDTFHWEKQFCLCKRGVALQIDLGEALLRLRLRELALCLFHLRLCLV